MEFISGIRNSYRFAPTILPLTFIPLGKIKRRENNKRGEILYIKTVNLPKWCRIRPEKRLEKARRSDSRKLGAVL